MPDSKELSKLMDDIKTTLSKKFKKAYEEEITIDNEPIDEKINAKDESEKMTKCLSVSTRKTPAQLDLKNAKESLSKQLIYAFDKVVEEMKDKFEKLGIKDNAITNYKKSVKSDIEKEVNKNSKDKNKTIEGCTKSLIDNIERAYKIEKINHPEVTEDKDKSESSWDEN